MSGLPQQAYKKIVANNNISYIAVIDSSDKLGVYKITNNVAQYYWSPSNQVFYVNLVKFGANDNFYFLSRAGN